MVLWCKSCGAFLGIREPLSDWTVYKTELCQACKEKATESTSEEGDAAVKDQPPEKT